MSVIRTCYRCLERKPISEFYGRPDRPQSFRYDCKECQKFYQRKRRREFGDKVRQHDKDYDRRLRLEMIKAYGGRCACCGESKWEFLELDHTNGDGASHRKSIKGCSISKHLKKRGYPKEGYRLLCSNCNLSRARYGYCPHQKT